ncbi:mechanosensitive ion channel family protein [Pseudobdellovibrio exovorus]|uniref:Mechano-sensitive ion channel n=1 Tax=Pseudobdellovibrio exovorus JSS TaxID=1184267 RepID=M4V7W7_9BACT|nr:mechanosensitive ion channel family protein [Pseudobdellovibrio exovorus]AGH94520.1 hypothetical protein A11Q_300 [Pseudobdellovibrio exovorus JSS]
MARFILFFIISICGAMVSAETPVVRHGQPHVAQPAPLVVPLTDNAHLPKCYRVQLAEVDIACVKQGLGSFSSAERAEKMQERIEKLAQNSSFDEATISIIKLEGAYDLMAQDNIIASFRDGDLELNEGQTHETEVQMVVQQTQQAIRAYRDQHSPETLAWGLLYTAIATVGLLIILTLFKKAYVFLYAFVKKNTETYIRSFKFLNNESYLLLNPKSIAEAMVWLISAVRVVLTLIVFYIYVPLIFSFFPLTEKWTPVLFDYILNPLLTIGRVVVNYLPNLFYVVMIGLVTHYVLKVIHFIFREVERGRLQFPEFHREWADPTFKLVRVLVLALAFVMAFPYLPGSGSPAFQGVSVFLGLLVSFGSSSAISNIVSGIVITYMRPFKPGDRVKIADTMGDVIEKSLLVTRIRSIKNVEITIPNSMVLGSHIVNYSASAEQEGLILNATVTIGYEVPWRQVHELLKSAALKTDLVDKNKAPFILQTALNDFNVAYELNAYTTEPNRMIEIYSGLYQNIQDAFNEAGVEILSPQYSAIRDGGELSIPEEYKKPNQRNHNLKVSVHNSAAETQPKG